MQKIKEFLGLEDFSEENKKLRQENMKLRLELAVSKLKSEEKNRVDVPVAGFDSTDTEPTDRSARAEYIKEVTNFHDTILFPKLKTSIAEVRRLLSNITPERNVPANMTRPEYDAFLRGMEAMAWKIHNWCIVLAGERREGGLQDVE